MKSALFRKDCGEAELLFVGSNEECSKLYKILYEYHKYDRGVGVYVETPLETGIEQEHCQKVLDDPDFRYGH
jgi:hypothetical protein